MTKDKELVEVEVKVVLEVEPEEVADFGACVLAESAATALRAWDGAIVEETWRVKGEE